MDKTCGLSTCGHQNLNLCEYQVSWIWFILGFFFFRMSHNSGSQLLHNKVKATQIHTFSNPPQKKKCCDLPLTMLQSLVFKIKKSLEEGETVRAKLEGNVNKPNGKQNRTACRQSIHSPINQKPHCGPGTTVKLFE